ncbi:TPA: Paratox, partial [Streptococcus pyogenes]|nr:Paratox [Streptococcus pyogenes]
YLFFKIIFNKIKQAIDNGDITRDTVVVVLKNGRFFDDMLLHEEVSNRRAVIEERGEEALMKLDK